MTLGLPPTLNIYEAYAWVAFRDAEMVRNARGGTESWWRGTRAFSAADRRERADALWNALRAGDLEGVGAGPGQTMSPIPAHEWEQSHYCPGGRTHVRLPTAELLRRWPADHQTTLFDWAWYEAEFRKLPCDTTINRAFQELQARGEKVFRHTPKSSALKAKIRVWRRGCANR